MIFFNPKMMKMKYQEQIRIIKQIRRAVKNDPRFKNHKIEFGYKCKNGKLTKELSIRVFVPQKLPLSELGENKIPEYVDGIPTDILQDNFKVECKIDEPTNFFPQVVGGIEIKNSRFFNIKGTLGCVVLKDNVPFGLSCHHVLFGHNEIGERGSIMQPAGTNNKIGKVINHQSYYSRKLDAAIFQIADRDYNWEQNVNGFCGLIKYNRHPVINDEVFKYGSVTKDTKGFICGVCIDDEDFTIIKYDNDQNMLSDKGDSGSLWLTNVGNQLVGVGLHYYGENGKLARAKPLTKIFRKFNLKYFSQSI